MNVHLAKFIMYYEVQKLHREGHSISRIHGITGLNRRTIAKYLSMSEIDYETLLVKQADRKKELDPYEGFVKERLVLYPETSAAQMHDWLKEHHPDFPKVNPKTIFNFIYSLRNKYNIPKIALKRQYQMVEELPYGKQGQADFGEYNMRDTAGQRVKVFFFTFVLSRSRYKFIWFLDKHFTGQFAAQAHELTFAYIGGIPDEIVYDQDKVFLVSENNGDIILTDTFRTYTRDKSFRIYFCRKSDPESKGKVENVVKYVKQNFLYNRTFHNIETLNDEALAWLGRTANAMPHNVTLKPPRSEWVIEKEFLKKHVPVPITIQPVFYTVRKDNTISWKSNFYSLPPGTYTGRGAEVSVQAQQNEIVIFNKEGKELCRHLIRLGKGLKVLSKDHERDHTTAIAELMDRVAHLTTIPEQAKAWFEMIRSAKCRYLRDQLILIRKTIEKADTNLIARTILYCLENNITSGTDFSAIVRQQQSSVEVPECKVIPLNPLTGTHLQKATIVPNKSAIEDYQAIVESFTK